MAFTPQQEAEILRNLRNLSESARNNHFRDTRTAFTYIGGLLGASAANYAVNHYGWPAVEKKIKEIWNKR
jgi:hypothetical protein